MDTKLEAGFKQIGTRMDALEKRVANVEQSIPDGNQMEHHVERCMSIIFAHDLESFKWNISRELRVEMKLKPPQDGPPPIYELDGNKL
ncbi:hypothetical protein LIER_25542 [Lithospermum erythrorhizon]|uniref:Uncharacterized protein n=1 Tax=Lithospermum erythrorhizon TaxID=34254 RepID=A0AAV3R791_LITER